MIIQFIYDNKKYYQKNYRIYFLQKKYIYVFFFKLQNDIYYKSRNQKDLFKKNIYIFLNKSFWLNDLYIIL